MYLQVPTNLHQKIVVARQARSPRTRPAAESLQGSASASSSSPTSSSSTDGDSDEKSSDEDGDGDALFVSDPASAVDNNPVDNNPVDNNPVDNAVDESSHYTDSDDNSEQQ